MTQATMKQNACHHCGMLMLGFPPGKRVWCQKCSLYPGPCHVCKRDKTEATGCWQIEQAMDKALHRAHFAADRCLYCGTTMTINAQAPVDTHAGEAESVVLQCWRCQAYCRVTWLRTKPPEPGAPESPPQPPPILK